MDLYTGNEAQHRLCNSCIRVFPSKALRACGTGYNRTHCFEIMQDIYHSPSGIVVHENQNPSTFTYEINLYNFVTIPPPLKKSGNSFRKVTECEHDTIIKTFNSEF